jgi:hypothetical protein
VDVITDILQTQVFNTAPSKKGKTFPSSSECLTTEPIIPGLGAATPSVDVMRVKLASSMWSVLTKAIPMDSCLSAGEKLIQWIDAYSQDVLPDAQIDCGIFCADIISIMDVSVLRGCWQHWASRGWASTNERNAIWRGFSERWIHTSGSWDDSVALLCIPFA